MRIPTLEIDILLESNPLRSRILVRGLAVTYPQFAEWGDDPISSPKLSEDGSCLVSSEYFIELDFAASSSDGPHTIEFEPAVRYHDGARMTRS